MQPDRPFGNRQAQPCSAGLAVAGIIQPVKGLENLLQCLIRNPGARILYADNNLFVFATRGPLPLQSHLHCRAFGSISRCVPNHILNGAAQQVGIGFNQEFVLGIGRVAVTRQPRPGVSYSASCATCFDQFAQRKPGLVAGRRLRFQTRNGQQALDQLVQPVRLKFDAVERGFDFGAELFCRASPSATLSRASGERSSCDTSFSRRDCDSTKPSIRSGHAVKIAHQLGEFVAASTAGAPVRVLKSPAARLCAA